MKTFKQFQASKRMVYSLAEALPDTAYYLDGPGLVYDCETYIQGPCTVYENPVEKTGAHHGSYLLCLGNMEYTTAEGYTLEQLERLLYDFCVSEGIL